VRIAIVNDLRLAAETLRRVVLSRPGTEVAWIAIDGQDALAKCKADVPDLVLMDMIMPVMDGVEATRRIMRECPCPIVVVTATVEGNASKVFDALGHGALDAVNTPRLGLGGNVEGGAELIRKIDLVEMLSRPARPGPVRTTAPFLHPASGSAPLLAIGASTGGPQALVEVLSALPKPFHHPIVVVQHVGVEFVPGLADWLSRQASRPVRIVTAPEAPADGTVHLCGREAQFVLDTAGRLAIVDKPTDRLHKPSVDALFDSLASSGRRGVAVLLTGMGRDGAEGLLGLRKAGWWTIAQDRDSSVVWGMPGEAVRIGAADEILPLSRIAPAIAAAFVNRVWRRNPTDPGSFR
jgi:two-component system response regulator WspF